VFVVITIIIYLSWSWTTCWSVPVSRNQKSLQRSTVIPSAIWGVVCVCSPIYPTCNAHAPYCHLACPALQYFSILSHKRHDFRKKKKFNGYKMCVCWFRLQGLSETFLVLRRNERDMTKNEYRSSCKVPVMLVRFEWKFNFLGKKKKKNAQISNFMKVHPVEAELCHVDRRKDRHEANSSLSQVYKRA
jgi:hypothetical protein